MMIDAAPLVTIFVQVYNTKPYLKACLDSVLALNGDYPLEVIVIDDASTDGSANIVKGYSDPRIRLIIHERNQGAIATANEGYSLAKGEFVARLDSDDCYRSNFLVSTVPILQERPEVGLVYGDIAHIDELGTLTFSGGGVSQQRVKGTLQEVSRGSQTLQVEIGDEFFALLERNYIPAPSTLVRRQALKQSLPVPGELSWLDWYITTGIAETWKCAYVDEVLANYRIHSQNMHSAMVQDRKGEATTFRVLEQIFSTAIRDAEKNRRRNKVFGTNYLTYAEKYFGHGMNQDARRCYVNAFKLYPWLALKPGVLRHFLATFLPRNFYNDLKRVFRGLQSSI